MSSPQEVKATEPALFITTQSTVPILTQIMAGFSLAVLGIAAATTQTPIPLCIGLNTKDSALVLISLAALAFLFATEACVKSQGWDYFALSQERRDFVRKNEQAVAVKLSTDPAYQERCVRESELWHKIAIWSYRIGTVFLVLGIAFLFWPISKMTSIVVSVYLLLAVIVFVIVRHREEGLF